MAEEEPGSSTGEEHDEEEAPAAAAAADPKQDDVKPVIFIGLFIATLFTMGIVKYTVYSQSNKTSLFQEDLSYC